MSTFRNGDRVAYRAAFLRSIGDRTHATASRRGTVIKPEAYPGWKSFAAVRWDDRSDAEPTPVNVTNLVLANRHHLEPQ